MDYDKIGNKVLRKGRFLCTKNHSCLKSRFLCVQVSFFEEAV